MKDEKIQAAFKVKKAVAEYFAEHPEFLKVRAIDLMDFFVEKKIFAKDEKLGLPIRSLLNELQKKNLMALVPQAYAEQKEKGMVWFFSKANLAANSR